MVDFRKWVTAFAAVLALLALGDNASAQNRTRFAGNYNALDYAYGQIANVGPLRVDIGNTSTSGAQTLTLAFGYIALGDGTNYMPLSTSVPITVGLGTNAETVTPSAVSCSTPGILDTCTVTATFSNTHGVGDLVASSTWGLDEAVEAAIAAGGGSVSISSSWTSYGGTQTMVNSARALLGLTVNIGDYRNGGPSIIAIAEGTIANAQVLTLETVAQQIIPPQGAGTLIDVLDAYLENANTGTAYAGSPGVLCFCYQAAGAASQTYPAAPTIAATFLTSPTVAQSIRTVGVLSTVASSNVLNTGVYLSVLTNNPTT